MNHISEEQFVLFYYGEADEASGVESHMAECEACREEFRALQLVLNSVDAAPVPERGPEYGSQVWQRIAKQIPQRKRKPFTWWVWAPAMAALVLGAFLAGRMSNRNLLP